MNSIEKTMKLLEILTAHPEGMSLKELAHHLELSAPATLHYTKSLMKCGYLSKELKSNNIKLTYKLIILSHSFLRENPIVNSTTPTLKKLSETLNSSVHLAIKVGNKGVCVNLIDSPNAYSSLTSVGLEFDLYPTALGRAILAFLPEDELDSYFNHIKLIRYTPQTLTSEVQIREKLAETHEAEYSLDFEEHKLGLCSMGCPIFDEQRYPIGAISTIIPFEPTKSHLENTFNTLRSSADYFSSEFKHLFYNVR